MFSAATSPAEAAPDRVVVSQRDRAFSTGEVELHAGGTLHFTNDDDFSHQVFVQSPAFSIESDEQPPGQNLDVRFPKAGAFDVQCHIHPKMHLRVVVH